MKPLAESRRRNLLPHPGIRGQIVTFDSSSDGDEAHPRAPHHRPFNARYQCFHIAPNVVAASPQHDKIICLQLRAAKNRNRRRGSGRRSGTRHHRYQIVTTGGVVQSSYGSQLTDNGVALAA